MPNQNKTPCSMNLEQTRKSSLRSHGVSVVPFPHLEFMNDCGLPCYIGMSDLPWQKQWLWAARRVRSGHFYVTDERNPSTNLYLYSLSFWTSPVLNMDVFAWSVFSFFFFKPTHRSFVVLKMLPELCGLCSCKCAYKDLCNGFHCKTKFNWVFTHPSVLGWQESKLGLSVSTNPTQKK